jgi:hypothetical protein
MTVQRKPTREPGRIYIDELAKIVNRQPNTIRKWERLEMLPAHLIPQRGTRRWRYWTEKQVYGPRGVIKWMKDNDIRPGAYLTMPSGEAKHIANMRRPRGITLEMIEEIRYHARTFKSGDRKGKHRHSRRWIIQTYFSRTAYTSESNFEKALVAYFAAQGWEFPPPTRTKQTKRRASDRMTPAQIKKHPEVRRATREANRIVRIVDKKLTAKGK